MNKDTKRYIKFFIWMIIFYVLGIFGGKTIFKDETVVIKESGYPCQVIEWESYENPELFNSREEL